MRLKRLDLAVGLSLLALACRTAPSANPALPRRAIILSLDGAGAAELWRLHEAGVFGADGFERLLREGRVAQSLTPVNPALTAVNHIALASGFPPSVTGIVSNSFHLTDEPITQRADGFLVPNRSEFIWQAARRQGKKAGVVAWPGLGGRGSATAADWGMLWNSNTLRPASVIEIAPSDWHEATSPVGLQSFSPGRRVGVELKAEKALPAQTLEVWALDRRDDGAVAYDALAVRDLASAEAPVLLELGQAARLAWTTDGESAPASEWFELLDIEADGKATLYLSRVYRNMAYPDDYDRRLAASGVLWPPPPDDDSLEDALEGRPGLSLDSWLAQSDRFAAFFVDCLLAGIRGEDWDLAVGYVPTIDESAHQLLLVDPRQPGWTAEREREFSLAREHVWKTADREVARLLARVDPATTAVFLVSDHGLAPVHTAIDANAVLRLAGFAKVGEDHRVVASETRALAFTSGGAAHLYLNLDGREPGGLVARSEAKAVLAEIRQIFAGLRSGDEAPIARIFDHGELGPLGLDDPNSGDLLLVAAPGYWFASSRPMASQPLFATPAYGQHGYLNDDPRMPAIFLSWGRDIEPGRLGALPNTEVAARVAGSLGIEPPLAVAPRR